MSYFKQALERIEKMHISKAEDYTRESEFENFEHSAKASGISVLQAIDVLVSTKEARIISLRGREARNESIEDTYLDRAVYAIIAYARVLYEKDGPQRIQVEAMLNQNAVAPSSQLNEPVCLNCNHPANWHGPNLANRSCLCCSLGNFIPIKYNK